MLVQTRISGMEWEESPFSLNNNFLDDGQAQNQYIGFNFLFKSFFYCLSITS